jgi:ABC-type uncharacterized transport system auxiliary subunit
MVRIILINVCLVFLYACSKGSTIPEDRFYRLPEPVAVANIIELTAGGIFVQRFLAEGLYRERPILTVSDSQGIEVEQYDYHLWIDTPTRLLRDQLIAYLNKAQVAKYVVDTTDMDSDLRIHGKLLRFEIDEYNGQVTIKIQFRVEHRDQNSPVLLKEYEESMSVSNEDMRTIIQVYGNVLNSIFGKFLTDLSTALSG